MVILLGEFFASLQYRNHDYHDLMYFDTIDAISIIIIYSTNILHTHIYIHETTFFLMLISSMQSCCRWTC